MDNFDNNFKNLIATHFQNERVEVDNGWSFMENKLKKQNFYTFGYYHFNLYYVLLSVVAISSLVFLYQYKTSLSDDNTFIEDNSFSKPNQNVQESISYPNNGDNAEMNAVFSDSINNTSITEDSKKQESVSKKTTLPQSNSKKDAVNAKKEPNTLNNNILETFNESNDLNKSNSIESKKTIVVQESFDTIHKVDTQYVNKKSFFKKN
ncbi:MAG: hypothetical protein IPO21_05955 [Bacteroidales bacterium]|nr:hypothetical protein [Bacteroidales bacterium]